MAKVEKNVMDFLGSCSDKIGLMANESFNQEVFCNFIDLNISSPIEQILYIALKTVAKINFIENAEPYCLPDNSWTVRGLDIKPQYKIGQYRCDFLVTFDSYNISNSIIVECDSQQFHERNEHQRRYEKARDRYFIAQGYKTFHYTGSEIIKNHLEVAKEIIVYLTNRDKDDIFTNY